MRAFVDAILAVIDAASLTTEEFGYIEQTAETYTAALYAEILLVLDTRESISDTRSRLTSYFKALGVAVVAPAASKSNIFLGDTLC